MKRYLAGLFALLTFCATLAPATAQMRFVAQHDGNTKVLRGKTQKKFKSVTHLDFRGSHVDGQLYGPQIGTLTARKSPKFRSSIRYRAHFMRELHKSAKNL